MHRRTRLQTYRRYTLEHLHFTVPLPHTLNSRSTLHADGADVVKATVLNVAAFRGELLTLALEVLLLEHCHLGDTNQTKLLVCLFVCARPPYSDEQIPRTLICYLKKGGHTHARVDHGLHHRGTSESVHLLT